METVLTTLTASPPSTFQTQFRRFPSHKSTKPLNSNLPKFWTASPATSSPTTTLSLTLKPSAKRSSVEKVTSRVRFWLQGQTPIMKKKPRMNLRWFLTNIQKSQIQIWQLINTFRPPLPAQCSSLTRRWSVGGVKATWWEGLLERKENLKWLMCSWQPTTKCRKSSLVWV